MNNLKILGPGLFQKFSDHFSPVRPKNRKWSASLLFPLNQMKFRRLLIQLQFQFTKFFLVNSNQLMNRNSLIYPSLQACIYLNLLNPIHNHRNCLKSPYSHSLSKSLSEFFYINLSLGVGFICSNFRSLEFFCPL